MILGKLIVLTVTVIGLTGFSVNAQKFEWAGHLESFTSQVISNDVAIDADGNSYVTGYYTGITDFDPATATFVDTAGIQGMAFVAKYSSFGDLVWARSLNEVVTSRSFGISIGVRSGYVFVGGGFGDDSTDFDPGPGTFYMDPVNFDPYILKLDTTGNFIKVVQFESSIVPASQSLVQDLVLAQNGDVVVVGRLNGSVDFDPGLGTDVLTSSGGNDLFVCKLDVNLNHIWAKKIGAIGADNAYGVALDPYDNICFTGNFSNTVDFDPGPGTFALTATGIDAYIAKLTPQGDLIWAKRLAGNGTIFEQGQSIAVDTSGGIYTVGTFSGIVDFDPGPGSMFLDAGSSYYPFLCKLDSNGNYQWVHQVGNGIDTRGFGYDVTTDILNNVYFTGEFEGLIDINLGPQTQYIQTTFFNSDSDMFMIKLDQDGNYNWSKTIGGTAPSEIFYGIQVDSALNVYTTGQFQSPADFDTGQDTLIFVAEQVGTDAFIHKLSNCTQTFSSILLVECAPYVTPSGNMTYTQSGIYNDVIDNAQGCDSVITIDLTIIGASSSSQINVTIPNCDYYVSPSGNYTLQIAGVYTDTLVNSDGCDSVITINVASNSTLTSITATACDGYSSPSGNEFWVNSGIYYDTLVSSAGCDSIIKVVLTINSSASSVVNITACGQYTSPSGNYVWTSDGTYQDTILTSSNCDSMLTINLTIISIDTTFVFANECIEYLSPSGLFVWTTSGIYTETLANIGSCDSIVTTDLTIDPIIASITQIDEYTLEAGPSSATYQWLDCLNGMLPIAGEYAQTFSNVPNGSYAVVVSNNSCSDTSDCIVISNGASIILYPNPTQGEISIQMINVSGQVEVIVQNALGVITFSEYYNLPDDEILFEIVGPAGVYTVEIITDQFTEVQDFIKL